MKHVIRIVAPFLEGVAHLAKVAHITRNSSLQRPDSDAEFRRKAREALHKLDLALEKEKT